MNRLTKPEAARLAWKAEDLGTTLLAISLIQEQWSQRTFGPDTVASCRGPLNHLKREAQEAIDTPQDVTEFADCLLLVMDASRRAGHTLFDLIEAARRKQQICLQRKYGPPDAEGVSVHVDEKSDVSRKNEERAEIIRACNPEPGDVFVSKGRKIHVKSVCDGWFFYDYEKPNIEGVEHKAAGLHEWPQMAKGSLSKGASFIPHS